MGSVSGNKLQENLKQAEIFVLSESFPLPNPPPYFFFIFIILLCISMGEITICFNFVKCLIDWSGNKKLLPCLIKRCKK